MALGLHGGSFSRQRPSCAKAAVRQAGPAARQALGLVGRNGLHCGSWASRARQPACNIHAGVHGFRSCPPPVGRGVPVASSSSGRVLVQAPAWARGHAWGGCLGGRSGRGHVFHAKAESREDPMRERQFFAYAIGPRRRSRFSTKAIRSDSRRSLGGPGCQASVEAR
jgi:hypothetical protein